MPSTTILTPEMLALSVTYPVAAMTGLRGVCRVDQHQRHAELDRFVAQELAQLVKGPTVRATALCFVSRLGIGPFPDTAQIFYGNTPPQRFSGLDDAIADGVIDVGLDSCFSAPKPCLQFSDSTPSTASAFGGPVLQSGSQAGEPVSKLTQLLSTVLLSRAGMGNISTAKVYSNAAIRFRWLAPVGTTGVGRFRFDLNLKVIGAVFAFYQSGRSWFLPFEQMSLVVADGKRDMLSASQQSQAGGPLLLIKRKDAGVVVNACRRKILDQLVFQLGSLAVGTDTGNRSDSEVGRQAKGCPALVVDKLLHACLIGQRIRCSQVNPGAGIRKSLKGGINLVDLLSRWVELAGYGQHLGHDLIISHPPRIEYAI